MAKHNLRELDQGQLQTMWNFLKLQRKNTCTKTKRASGHHPASNGTENSWSERYRPRYIC